MFNVNMFAECRSRLGWCVIFGMEDFLLDVLGVLSVCQALLLAHRYFNVLGTARALGNYIVFRLFLNSQYPTLLLIRACAAILDTVLMEIKKSLYLHFRTST